MEKFVEMKKKTSCSVVKLRRVKVKALCNEMVISSVSDYWWLPTVRSSLPNLTLIGSGVGVYGPQNWKKSNFTNIIAPKGRVPCTIFTKFTAYMRVLVSIMLLNLAALFR